MKLSSLDLALTNTGYLIHTHSYYTQATPWLWLLMDHGVSGIIDSDTQNGILSKNVYLLATSGTTFITLQWRMMLTGCPLSVLKTKEVMFLHCRLNLHYAISAIMSLLQNRGTILPIVSPWKMSLGYS